MSTFKKTISVIGLSTLAVFAFSLVGTAPYLINKAFPASKSSLSEVKNSEANTEFELIGTTPEGTKIYRIRGEKTIVPMILVESYNGHVAIR